MSDTQVMEWWLGKFINEHEKNIVRDYQELKSKYQILKEEQSAITEKLHIEREDTKKIIESLTEAENKARAKQDKLTSISNLIDENTSDLALSIREIIDRQEG